jgi:hypothetical protein
MSYWQHRYNEGLASHALDDWKINRDRLEAENGDLIELQDGFWDCPHNIEMRQKIKK